MIRLENVTKYYWTAHGRRTVIDRVSIEFAPSMRVGILGGNGAGKSTLLRLLSGVEPPSEGQIVRRGRISWPLGFSGGLHPALTGWDNCRFVARIYGHDPDKVCDFVSDFANIGRNMDLPVSTYSSGMKAKVAHGLSFALSFDFYLIDESIVTGDAEFKEKCRALFESRAKRAGIVIVSHKMSTVREYANVGMILSGGRLIRYPSLEQAIEAYEGKGGVR